MRHYVWNDPEKKKTTITKIYHVFFVVVGFGLLVLGFFLRSQDYFLRLRSIFQASHDTALLVTSPSGETSSHKREVSLLPLPTGRAQSLPAPISTQAPAARARRLPRTHWLPAQPAGRRQVPSSSRARGASSSGKGSPGPLRLGKPVLSRPPPSLAPCSPPGSSSTPRPPLHSAAHSKASAAESLNLDKTSEVKWPPSQQWFLQATENLPAPGILLFPITPPRFSL